MPNSLCPTDQVQHARPPCSSPTLRVYSNSCPLCRWCHPTISSSVIPFSSAFNLSQHQGIFQWGSSSQQVATVSASVCYSLWWCSTLYILAFFPFYQWNHLIIQKFVKAPSRLVNSFEIPGRLCCAPNNSSNQTGWKDFATWWLFTLGHFTLHHAPPWHAPKAIFSLCLVCWDLGPSCALVCLLPSSPFHSGSQFPLNLQLSVSLPFAVGCSSCCPTTLHS